MRRILPMLPFPVGLLLVYAAQAWTPVDVADDPLVRLPGTQPDHGVSLEGPSRCLNCHEGYDTGVEPGWNWQGSMMAQASRDPVFWATFTVALQDSIWALGTPNAGDFCERCHFPEGWVEGRSDPPNATDMSGSDYDGVHCDVCHRMVDPHFQASYAGTREGTDFDESEASTTPSSTAALATWTEDASNVGDHTLFNGNDFYDTGYQPVESDWTEAAAGQMFLAPDSAKRGPFADEGAKHDAFYSRFHKSRYFCATCHDVSNPALHNLAYASTSPGDGTTVLPTESDPVYSYEHVERTFSEFMLSDFGADGGATGGGDFASLDTSRSGDAIQTCQDCHMADAVGYAADKAGISLRPTDSTEHPNSGIAVHDFTGGNLWVPWLLASADSTSSNYDASNEALLDQGASVLTLDLTQGNVADTEALLYAVERARDMVQSAATLEDVTYDADSGDLSFAIVNHTGHKLPTGFPEGRRMWVNVAAYDSTGSLIWEVNPFDTSVYTLVGLDTTYSPSSPAATTSEEHLDDLVYECKMGSTLTSETTTFHFVLGTHRYKDNRIPPAGFDIASAADRLVQPVTAGAGDTGLYDAAEYGGGYDQVDLEIEPDADEVVVTLYYQTTSREYMEFLEAEINGTASTLSSPTPSGETSAYIAQTDTYFSQLAAWGDTMWDLWEYNQAVDGAAPVAMTSATLTGCTDAEVCDGVDNDCDGLVDGDDPGVDSTSAGTWYTDADGDGYGDATDSTVSCSAPSGTVSDGTDCDDTDASVSPGGTEVCDGTTDEDCDGTVDEDDASDADTWYADDDGDGYGDATDSTTACDAPSGYVADATDCDDSDATASPGGTEVCGGGDEDCDGLEDDDDPSVSSSSTTTYYADDDGDGFGDASDTVDACSRPSGYATNALDCDDTDADVNPAGTEVCDGSADEDCDGTVDEDDASDAGTWYADDDGDGFGDASDSTTACEEPSGYVADATDCDDADATANPDGTEVCDGSTDEDCDGTVDEDDASDASTWYDDDDGDGFGDAADSTTACDEPSGYVADGSDCDDADADTWPGADETCDGEDDDCDGTVDDNAVDADTWYADADGDGYGDAADTAEGCTAPSGYVADSTDCDDADSGVNPGEDEVCDGTTDEDCDGTVDEDDAVDAATWYADADGDGYGDPDAATQACEAPTGYVSDDTDCHDGEPTVHPGGDEICNGLDDDCDGLLDADDPSVDPDSTATWTLDADGDGYGDDAISVEQCSGPEGYVIEGGDCDDADPSVHPGADEVCDGEDQDCDGVADDDAVDATAWYPDADGDGYGDPGGEALACEAPSGFVADASDCDDGDAAVSPGGVEVCGPADEDCDGLVDDDDPSLSDGPCDEPDPVDTGDGGREHVHGCGRCSGAPGAPGWLAWPALALGLSLRRRRSPREPARRG